MQWHAWQFVEWQSIEGKVLIINGILCVTYDPWKVNKIIEFLYWISFFLSISYLIWFMINEPLKKHTHFFPLTNFHVFKYQINQKILSDLSFFCKHFCSVKLLCMCRCNQITWFTLHIFRVQGYLVWFYLISLHLATHFIRWRKKTLLRNF